MMEDGLLFVQLVDTNAYILKHVPQGVGPALGSTYGITYYALLNNVKGALQPLEQDGLLDHQDFHFFGCSTVLILGFNQKDPLSFFANDILGLDDIFGGLVEGSLAEVVHPLLLRYI